MHYRQFLRSAERHLQICRQLLDEYDSLTNSQKKVFLLAEVYYLSGYILESSLSYAFFSYIRYTGDIYSSEHFRNSCFKTHQILMKYQYMAQRSCVINDLLFVSRVHKSKDLQTLFNQWDVKYRYEQLPSLDKRLIVCYIDEIEKGLIKIKTQFPS